MASIESTLKFLSTKYEIQRSDEIIQLISQFCVPGISSEGLADFCFRWSTLAELVIALKTKFPDLSDEELDELGHMHMQGATSMSIYAKATAMRSQASMLKTPPAQTPSSTM